MDGTEYSERTVVTNDGSLIRRPPEHQQYHVVVRVMMVFVSFVMGLSMMNLFIAMLCVSYGKASTSAPLAWTRMRACVVLDHQAIRHGFGFFSYSFRKRHVDPHEMSTDVSWYHTEEDRQISNPTLSKIAESSMP